MRDGEDVGCLVHIPIGWVCEGLQCLKLLPCLCSLQTESAPIPPPHECFQLCLPSVEVFSDSGDLEGELVILCKLPAKAPIAFTVGMLHNEVVMWGGRVEKG